LKRSTEWKHTKATKNRQQFLKTKFW